MSGQDGADDEDKQYEPSQKKLDDARRKGDVARSTDLIATGSYAGLVIAGAAFGAQSLSQFGATLAVPMDQADRASELFTGGGGMAFASAILATAGLALVPFAIGPGLAALISVIAQRAFTVAPDKLRPKLSKISILSNAKNKFGRSGLFEFAKSAFKLTIFGVVLFWYLSVQMPHIITISALEPRGVVAEMLRITLKFLFLILLISACIGVVDFFFQRAETIRKNRMSRKDLTDEQKQSEGDPVMKNARRQRGYDIATNKMLADVPESAVIVVNPTHYAVALKWDRSQKGAPVCVAKGVDAVAARIREIAEEANVPIHSDPPTARALHASVRVGDEVDADHFAPVAVAIRFAEDVRRKASQR